MNRYATTSDNDVADELEENADLCTCSSCPNTPIDRSKCCLSEAKIKNECQLENVNCVLKLKKIEKLWDKVNILFIG